MAGGVFLFQGENTVKKVIAIDGPAASGKSTVAQKTADALGGIFVSTGSLYRLTALFLSGRKVDCHDEAAVAAALGEIELRFENSDWVMNGVHYDEELRQPEIGALASVVAVYPEVRQFLLNVQRRQADGEGILVMEGRDIGSAIFPEAALKVFLTASPEERAQRRLKQERRGGTFTPEELAAVAKSIAERDERDRNRAVAPLKCLPDAKLLDSSKLSAEETASQIVVWAREIL